MKKKLISTVLIVAAVVFVILLFSKMAGLAGLLKRLHGR